MFHIAYDREESTEMYPRYFVYDDIDHFVHYKGTYTQCLIVVGAFSLDPTTTLEEIKNKCGDIL